MLAPLHRGRRQLRDLVPPWLRSLDQLPLSEDVRTRAATLGPVLDDLVDVLERQQRAMAALVPGLAATLAARAWLAWPRRRRGRILRGRQRRVARAAIEPLLKLADASLEPPVRL